MLLASYPASNNGLITAVIELTFFAVISNSRFGRVSLLFFPLNILINHLSFNPIASTIRCNDITLFGFFKSSATSAILIPLPTTNSSTWALSFSDSLSAYFLYHASTENLPNWSNLPTADFISSTSLTLNPAESMKLLIANPLPLPAPPAINTICPYGALFENVISFSSNFSSFIVSNENGFVSPSNFPNAIPFCLPYE